MNTFICMISIWYCLATLSMKLCQGRCNGPNVSCRQIEKGFGYANNTKKRLWSALTGKVKQLSFRECFTSRNLSKSTEVRIRTRPIENGHWRHSVTLHSQFAEKRKIEFQKITRHIPLDNKFGRSCVEVDVAKCIRSNEVRWQVAIKH